MIRPVLLLLGAVVAVAAVIAAADDLGAAVLSAGLLLVVAVVGVGAALLAARARPAVGSLHRQLSVSVAIAVGLTLLAAVLFGVVMFFSAHDALLMGLVTAFSGLVAVVTVWIVNRPILADVRTVSDALAAVAAGRRDGRVSTGGRDELAALAERTNWMVDRLAMSEADRREFVAAVSHDLRTPITSLRLIASALADDILEPPERRTYVERLQVHVTALSALIDDLFELSRIEAGDVAWSMGPVELPMLAGDTVDAMRADADARRVRIECDMPEGLPPARANPEKLQRVLFNLLQNAIQHTPPEGEVLVRAERVGDFVEVEVADTGEGVADRDRARVFDAFFQGGARAARSGSGAGLGLAISRAVVEAHGGRIWLERAERGARVRFSLPVHVA